MKKKNNFISKNIILNIKNIFLVVIFVSIHVIITNDIRINKVIEIVMLIDFVMLKVR